MKFTIKSILCSLFFISAFFLNSLPAYSQEICDGSYACAETKEKADGSIDFSIKNIRTYEITITINFPTMENLRADVTLPYTVTVPGSRTTKILTLYKNEPDARWRYYFKYNAIDGNISSSHDDDYNYSLPYASGKSFLVTQGFNGDFSHRGEQKYAIDWTMPEGTEIHAARGGVVAGLKEDSSIGGEDKSFAAYANYIIIRHSDGTFGGYLHLRKNGVIVSVGDKIKVGQKIGYSGNTGWSTAPHLHFWVYNAISGSLRQSFEIEFDTNDDEDVILEEDGYYTAK